MINNKQCVSCQHSGVCKFEEKLDIFDDDNKKFIGIDITFIKCKEFKEVE
jgi:hypothetical protein